MFPQKKQPCGRDSADGLAEDVREMCLTGEPRTLEGPVLQAPTGIMHTHKTVQYSYFIYFTKRIKIT